MEAMEVGSNVSGLPVVLLKSLLTQFIACSFRYAPRAKGPIDDKSRYRISDHPVRDAGFWDEKDCGSSGWSANRNEFASVLLPAAIEKCLRFLCVRPLS